MTPSSEVVQSLTVLGKRKAETSDKRLVLHLESSTDQDHTTSESESDDDTHDLGPSSASQKNKNRYRCTYDGCGKAYTKPVRLAEHTRSHTGERPFVCHTCNKSYLRETHLQAHERSHLPGSARPLACTWVGCVKRFWTSQHLRVHLEWHSGVKAFTCPKEGCDESFTKHNHLRNHIAEKHSPPGTKPYQCNHPACTKSFSTNQHLKSHLKVHDEKRYTCIQPACLASADHSLIYFATWTALQHHLRTVHPPTCTHPSCNNRVFASQKGLRAHQKLHEQNDIDAEVHRAVAISDSEEPPLKRRRGGEIGRDWKCEVEGCGKDFKSKKAFSTHNRVTHLGRRDFACSQPECGATYGYKHLLQRHSAKVHGCLGLDDESDPDTEGDPPEHHLMDIENITGKAYKQKSLAKLSSTGLKCPYPDVSVFHSSSETSPTSHDPHGAQMHKSPCDYVFTRAYDLRRHLRAIHNSETTKELVDQWVAKEKCERQTRGDASRVL
ncbi:transcription factor iiia [Pluteus cervinus]|uniref:Transcription factor iiia n=2 Tax=Pluteus cervinus TaxID=181527 RepID=A0ACD3A9M6_9AGAR|nr:transcription factor iiia [Pluteus cervinus]TFK62311.1 transcription factor iiia [Pluteus cervinus]